MLRALSSVALSLCLLVGCQRVAKHPLKRNVAMDDPEAAPQLLKGFYGLEGSTWRWTAQKFEVVFPGSLEREEHRPHTLKLSVYIPPAQIEKLGSLTLDADVNGVALPGETFSEPGVHSYVRAVPEEALQSNLVAVEFSLDKSTGPLLGEGRELGLIVNDAQLTAN